MTRLSVVILPGSEQHPACLAGLHQAAVHQVLLLGPTGPASAGVQRIAARPGETVPQHWQRVWAEVDSERILLLDPRLVLEPTALQQHTQATTILRGGSQIHIRRQAPLAQIIHRQQWNEEQQQLAQPGHRWSYRDLRYAAVSLPTSWLQAEVAAGTYLWPAIAARLLHQARPVHFDPHAGGRYDAQAETTDHQFQQRFHQAQTDWWVIQQQPELIPSTMIGTLVEQRRLSWLLRYGCFHQPWLGRMWANQSQALLAIAAQLKLRRLWQRLFQILDLYWYGRGIAELSQITTVEQLVFASQQAAAPEPHSLDLAIGLSAAEQQLDQIRPHSLRLLYHGHPIGEIPAVAGAEPLRGAQLRPHLQQQFAWRWLRAQALDGACAV